MSSVAVTTIDPTQQSSITTGSSSVNSSLSFSSSPFPSPIPTVNESHVIDSETIDPNLVSRVSRIQRTPTIEASPPEVVNNNNNKRKRSRKLRRCHRRTYRRRR